MLGMGEGKLLKREPFKPHNMSIRVTEDAYQRVRWLRLNQYRIAESLRDVLELEIERMFNEAKAQEQVA